MNLAPFTAAVSSLMHPQCSLKRTDEGFIKVNLMQLTSVKGQYAMGDCTNDLFQMSVASEHAAIAATDIHNQLDF